MRPIYESERDREAEAEAIATYAGLTGWHPVQMPRLYPYDYDMMRGTSRRAIVEVKCRKNPREEYSSLMIGHHKVETLYERAIALDCDGILLVRWTDSTGWLSLVEYPPTEWLVKDKRGRTVQTRDEHDIETCAFFPVSWFTVVEDRT